MKYFTIAITTFCFFQFISPFSSVSTSPEVHAAQAPEILQVDGQLEKDQVLKLLGKSFGSKATPAPITFHRFEEDDIGKLPNGWVSYQNSHGAVSDHKAYTGKQSLDTSGRDVSGQFFPRITFDIESGIGPGDVLFLSSWLYLDYSESTAANWNWKGPMLTSGLTPNYWSWSTHNHGVIGFSGFFEHGHGWYNPPVHIQYDHSVGGIAKGECLQGNSWQRDAFIFKQWQRIDWIFQASSSPAAADGKIFVNRVGAESPPLNAIGCTTHGDHTDAWRYINLPQGYTNIFNYGATTETSTTLTLNARTKVTIEPGMSIQHSVNGLIPDGTTVVSYDGEKHIVMSAPATATDLGAVTFGGVPPKLNLQMYFDDLYIDRSLARVELGDKPIYNECTQRELQIPISWQEDTITCTLNQGGFSPGQDLYLFVVDEHGNTSKGYGPMKLKGQTSSSEIWLLLESAMRKRD